MFNFWQEIHFHPQKPGNSAHSLLERFLSWSSWHWPNMCRRRRRRRWSARSRSWLALAQKWTLSLFFFAAAAGSFTCWPDCAVFCQGPAGWTDRNPRPAKSSRHQRSLSRVVVVEADRSTILELCQVLLKLELVVPLLAVIMNEWNFLAAATRLESKRNGRPRNLMNESDLAPAAVEDGGFWILWGGRSQAKTTRRHSLKLDAIWLAEYVTRLPTRLERGSQWDERCYWWWVECHCKMQLHCHMHLIDWIRGERS